MSDLDIKDIFDTNRVPGGWRILCLILYAPLGLALFFVRLFLSAILWLLGSVLPDSQPLRQFLHHGLSLVLGIVVKVSPDGESRDESSRIIIANSISALDHFALYKAAEALTPSLWELPSALSGSLGLRKMDMASKDILIRNIKHCITTSKCDIAIQPEFSATNSRVALLKFNSWPFSVENSVQPVVIKGWRPDFLGVNLTSVSSTWWADVFWFMFVPCTIFTLTYMKTKSNADHEILAREVEREIADALNIRTSSFTVTDKFEYEKRYIIENTQRLRTRRSTNPHAAVTMEIQRMVRQVRDVLPFVPGYVIQQDLLKTGNVDITVANLLDGIVTYTPEQRSPNLGASSASSNVQSSHDDNTRKNLSFSERKAQIIAAAREKYIKKHGIADC